MRDVLVYISGPISPKDGLLVEENVMEALAVFMELIEEGVPAFAPQFGAMFPSTHSIDYSTWMEYDFAVIRRCTHMLMMPMWASSPGAIKEAEYAREIGIPIVYSISQLIKLLDEE